jgi:glycosyltransferase involved in cell wall biosynthesis
MGAVAAIDADGLRARGFITDVLTPGYAGRERGLDAVYLKPFLALGNAAVLPQLLKRLNSYDLVHLHYPFYGADIFVWLWSILRQKPYVLTYHMRPQTSDWRNIIFRLHRYLIEPFILRRARAVLVSSLDYASSLGLRHTNLIDFPFGVDEQRFSPGRDDVYRAELGISSRALVFIFVGGLDRAHSFKGVDVLIRAAAYLPLEPDWRVLIVGDGDMKAAYQDLAKTLGIGERVIFAGAVSEADLPRAYRAAQVHVLPSVTQSEAFGLVTLEAAATGLPSVVSDLPGVRSLVVPNQTGLLVEAGFEESLERVMQRFLHEPSLGEQLGKAARQRVLVKYTRSSLADRLAEVYNGIST